MSEQGDDGKDGQSGAGYGDSGVAPQGGGMDSSGGTGSTGARQDGGSDGQPDDQAVQRSETIEAEDIEFEADDDLIDNDDG